MSKFSELEDRLHELIRQGQHNTPLHPIQWSDHMTDALRYAQAGVERRTTRQTEEERGLQLIYYRLRLPEGHKLPLNHLSLYIKADKAIVFIVGNDDKPLIIEDDPDLFPSDLLITQLRLLIG